MSKYTERAMERRRQFTPEGRPVFNCCQTVVSVFAEDLGYEEKTALNTATFFRGGMQMGSVCGAVTGSLMVLGLAGAKDAGAVDELYRRVQERHDGLMNCRDLLRVSAERGEVKLDHCNAVICECIGYTEKLLRARGLLPDESERKE